MSFVCRSEEEEEIREAQHPEMGRLSFLSWSHLVCRPRLALPVLQLLGVLLPDGEDPVVVAEVVAARRLAVLLSDWTEIPTFLNPFHLFI